MKALYYNLIWFFKEIVHISTPSGSTHIVHLLEDTCIYLGF